MKYTLESRYVIWNDDTGTKITVEDNADGLPGLIDLTYKEDREVDRMTLTVQQAELLVKALTRKLKDLENDGVSFNG
jgi:hypothetical protein